MQDEQDLRDTDGELKTNSKETFFYGLLHMEAPWLADLQEQTCIRSVQIEHAW